MIKIICHRGLWREKSEQNKFISFRRSLDNNFGMEIDLRDLKNEIIISHDPYFSGEKVYLKMFLKRFHKEIKKKNILLALNIKTDGISKKLKTLLNRYQIKNYFVFDMSVPETLNYKKNKLKFYERYSCYESKLHFMKFSYGIWVDSFEGKFFFPLNIKRKNLCFVSPELHKKKNINSFWLKIKKIKKFNQNIYLCTDYPFLAKEYFND